METNISRNDNKSVVNCVMGPCAFIATGSTQEVDTHKVDGVCAHTLGEACN
jgi:hypothetical protein